MKYKLIAEKLNEAKAVEEAICYTAREGKNTSPLYFERARILREVAEIK